MSKQYKMPDIFKVCRKYKHVLGFTVDFGKRIEFEIGRLENDEGMLSIWRDEDFVYLNINGKETQQFLVDEWNKAWIGFNS